MARSSKESDLVVDVEGIGQFTFGYRTFGDEMAIQREYARLCGGVEPTDWMKAVMGWVATFTVLTVFSPPGWDIDSMDPGDDETYANLAKVHAALLEKERSFRRQSKSPSEGSGARAA